METRKLPPTRNTHIHSAPVLAYRLDFELHNSPSPDRPLDLRDYGLSIANDDIAAAIRTVLDGPIGIYVDEAKQIWVCITEFLGFQPFLIPYPWERVPFAKGDCVFRDLVYDPGVDRAARPRIRCGTITSPLFEAQDPRRFQNPNSPEFVRVRWGEEQEEMREPTIGLSLYRGENVLHQF